MMPDDFGTESYAERYFEQLIADEHRRTFAIIYNDQHIGTVGLKDILAIEKTAECFIEIGETSCRGKGFGLGAMMLVLNYAFLDMRLEHVCLDVLEFNFPAIKVYDRLGFSSYGFNSWHYDEFGQYWRVLRMRISLAAWLTRRDAMAQKMRDALCVIA